MGVMTALFPVMTNVQIRIVMTSVLIGIMMTNVQTGIMMTNVQIRIMLINVQLPIMMTTVQMKILMTNVPLFQSRSQTDAKLSPSIGNPGLSKESQGQIKLCKPWTFPL